MWSHQGDVDPATSPHHRSPSRTHTGGGHRRVQPLRGELDPRRDPTPGGLPDRGKHTPPKACKKVFSAALLISARWKRSDVRQQPRGQASCGNQGPPSKRLHDPGGDLPERPTPDTAPSRASFAGGPRHHTMQKVPSARRWGAPGQVAFAGLPAHTPPLTAWWLW